MEQYKQEFIEFMVESNVLKFGDFTLKSGRILCLPGNLLPPAVHRSRNLL